LADIYKHTKKSGRSIAVPQQIDVKKRLLWSGVGTLALLVFGFWIWNLRVMFYDITHNAEAAEPPIWEETKDDFAAALAIIKEEQKTQVIEEELEEQGLDDQTMKEKIQLLLGDILKENGGQSASSTATTTNQEE
jgi:hypothetical protein